MSSEKVGVENIVAVEEQGETEIPSVIIPGEELDDFFGEDTGTDTGTDAGVDTGENIETDTGKNSESETETEDETIIESVQVIDYSEKLDVIIGHLEFYTCVLILALCWFLFKQGSKILDKLF